MGFGSGISSSQKITPRLSAKEVKPEFPAVFVLRSHVLTSFGKLFEKGKERLVHKAVPFAALLLLALYPVRLLAAGTVFPLSEIVSWNNDGQRKDYERRLRVAGVVFRASEFPGPYPRLAGKQRCLFFEKNGGPLAYGIDFEGFFDSVFAENEKTKDRREILLKRAEVLEDFSGRRIFLVGFEFQLTTTERFFAKWVLWQNPEAERAIFELYEGLGEGYWLDAASLRLAETLLSFPKLCLEQALREKAE